MSSLCPVILAGGGGTRLWPLSREHYPKQFLKLIATESMLQLTLQRMEGIDVYDIEISKPVIICNEEYRFLISDHASDVVKDIGSIILEPEGRNTAPALTSAAFLLQENDPVLLMMPADHLIRDIPSFQSSLVAGYKLAQQEGNIVTFGIKPESPETGFGYIKTASFGNAIEDISFERIERFVEKPNQVTAEKYFNSMEYFWNSGIFMMKASTWLGAIKYYSPEIFAACNNAVEKGKLDNVFFRLDKDAFHACPNDSIDYAVMEKICQDKNNFMPWMVLLDSGWSDIGSWSSVWQVGEKSQDNNVVYGNVISEDTRNSLVSAENRLVATIGCENMLIVETKDAVLICNRDRAQDVKKIVSRLKSNNREEAISHKKVYRPWGSYETIDEGDRFQVKRLIVNPGKKLSLQLHHHRAEHWVVVNGIATVTCGEDTFDLKANESTYIPVGTKHRLENRMEETLEVIEVQSGGYLGEDDIERFDDDFGRHR